MSAAPADPKEPKLRTTLPPLPTTRRGYGIVLNQSPKDGKIVYTNGRTVVIRSIANPSESLLFTEHKAAVSAAVFAPNGNWVASGDVEGNVIIWSYPQLKVKNTFQIAKMITDLDWDADSQRIVAGGDGAQKARVFSWDSGNNLGEITMHSHPVISVSYRKVRPFRIATGSEDLTVNLYAGPPFKYEQSHKGHARYPNGVRYSPDGSKFASVGADSKIVLFDGTTGAVIKEADDKTANAHKGAIYAFSWSPDGAKLLTASADKTAKIWNATDLTVEQTFTFGTDTMDQQVGALWTASELITVSLSGAINYLDQANPAAPKRVLHGHQTTIQSIALDPSNGCFYTSGLTGEITRWEYASGDAKWLAGKGHGGKVVANLALAGKNLISVGMDDKLRCSETGANEVASASTDLGGLPQALAVKPTDPSIAVVGLKQQKLLLLVNNEVQHTLPIDYEPQCIAFSPDGNTCLVGGKDKKIHVYDSSRPALGEVKVITAHDKPVTSLKFSPNGQFLASTDMDASVYIHQVSGGNYELKNKSGWRFHQAAVRDCDWSSDSSRLVTSGLDTHLIVWRDMKEFQGGERARAKDAHIDGTNYVKFWDDQTLISVGGDRAIKIWNAEA